MPSIRADGTGREIVIDGRTCIGDVAVCHDPRALERRILKRVIGMNHDGYDVRGDNEAESTDNRNFGTIPGTAIIGKVIFPK